MNYRLKNILFSNALRPIRDLRRVILREVIDWNKAISSFFWNAVVFSPYLPNRHRRTLLGLHRGVKIHKDSCINGGGGIEAATQLRIEEQVFINHGVWFRGPDVIKIGAGTGIGCECLFVTSSHLMGPPERRTGKDISKPITVGVGVWMGARCTILGGVNIGDGCVIAAGSVVNKSLGPHGLYAGVPARRVRDLSS